MSDGQDWKTVGLQILQVHTEECGDGSCGCGCGDLGLGTVKLPDQALPGISCEPVDAPKSCR